jgi:hypothetical protein
MRKTVIALCAAALAAPLSISAAPSMAQGITFEVGPGGPRVGFYTDGPYGYYDGYRGYRDRRAGWRYYNGYWFPPDAFVDRRTTRSIYRAERRAARRADRAHVDWCYDRYRSYREYDNTYQPTRGVRRECISPYS